MKPLGIRNRILLAALAPAVLVAILVSGMLVLEQLKQTQATQHRRLATRASQLAAAAEYNLFVGNVEGLRKLLETALAEPDVIGAAIYGPQGQLLANFPPAGDLPREKNIIEGFALSAFEEDLVRWHRSAIHSNSLRDADLFPMTAGSGPPLLGHLLLKVSNQSLRDDVRHAIATAAGLSLLMLLLGVILALALSRGLIQTLTNIRTVVDSIAHGRRHQPIRSIGNDELGELATGINIMADVVAQTKEDLAARIAEATVALRRERDEAAQASLARSHFFTAASHDLRQPVQALGLFTARLERDAERSTLKPGIVQIAQSVKTLQGLLDTLFDYSRLDGQVFRIDLHPLHAAEFLADIRSGFAAAAVERRLDLRLHVNDCWLMTDRALLHRILLNLVSNALRYTRAGAVLLACRHGKSYARIEVWDTGPGIPAEHQDAIFDELVQLDNPERDAHKGLGLGLAIVRRTADLLGHPVRLHSRPGKGSCFSVTIPLAAPPADANAGAHDMKRAAAPFLVLGTAADTLDDVASALGSWDMAHVAVASLAAARDYIATNGLPAALICATGGALDIPLETLDRLDATAGVSLPALLIHPGPHPSPIDCGRHRHLLARPFRPARLRALIDFLRDAND